MPLVNEEYPVRPRAEVLSIVGLMARAGDNSQTWVSDRCGLEPPS